MTRSPVFWRTILPLGLMTPRRPPAGPLADADTYSRERSEPVLARSLSGAPHRAGQGGPHDDEEVGYRQEARHQSPDTPDVDETKMRREGWKGVDTRKLP